MQPVSGHLRSTRKSSTEDFTSMIQMSPLRVSATRSARRPLASASSGHHRGSHLDQQALDATAHTHGGVGLASVNERVDENRRDDGHGRTNASSRGD